MRNNDLITNMAEIDNGSCVDRCSSCSGGDIICQNGKVTNAWGWVSAYDENSCGGCGKIGNGC